MDTRPAATFKQGHLKGALNIPDGGYRSGMASSILEQHFGQQLTVVDIGEAIKEFQKK